MAYPKTISRWSLPVVAIAAGWIGGRLTSLDPVGEARAAAPMAPLQRLVAQDDIRQRIALYGLYVDGDGMGGRKRDLRTLADTLMTPDVVSEIHPANGSAVILLHGRDIVAGSRPDADPALVDKIAGRHYLLNTVFDRITPTTALTRNTAVYFDATKNQVGPKCASATAGACGGVPVKTVMWVYEMEWRNTKDGWQISRNILRDDN